MNSEDATPSWALPPIFAADYPEHLVAPKLELVVYLLNIPFAVVSPQTVAYWIDVRRPLPAHVQKREDPHLPGNPAHLQDGLFVKSRREMLRVREQQMGAEAEVELPITKRQMGQLMRQIASLRGPCS